jgi:hypothetical protein
LAILAQEFQKSIVQIESTLFCHLQENQEANRRGQVEIYETLRKVDTNQTTIAELLMDMSHKGKGPETYDNRETGGSHGGNRYNPDRIPYHQSEGSNGGGAPHSRTTPRRYLPTFIDEHAQHEPVDDFVE